MHRRLLWPCVALAVIGATGGASAGVTNPDISVIGQPFIRLTNDASDPAAKRPVLDPGEVEFFFDAYLNPYARGTFVMAVGDEGAEIEEGYFTLLRGLPGGLALKGGKYRLGFGRLNPIHPHAYPFAERFRVLSAYLPGEESFNDTAVELSYRLPTPGDWSVTASADWLQGDEFRLERESSGATTDPLEVAGTDGDGDRAEEPRPGVLGRLEVFAPIGEKSGFEFGLSATQGTNNAAAATRTRVIGGDAKLKWWNSERSYLVVQGEVLSLDREDAGWDSTAAAYTRESATPLGGYLYADYNFNTRWNVGAGFERWQQPEDEGTWDAAIRAFAGFSLMEETTAFRLDWERYQPGTPAGASESPEAIDTFTFRVVFSMGPHKAHQF